MRNLIVIRLLILYLISVASFVVLDVYFVAMAFYGSETFLMVSFFARTCLPVVLLKPLLRIEPSENKLKELILSATVYGVPFTRFMGYLPFYDSLLFVSRWMFENLPKNGLTPMAPLMFYALIMDYSRLLLCWIILVKADDLTNTISKVDLHLRKLRISVSAACNYLLGCTLSIND